MSYGFIRTATVVPQVNVADCVFNTQCIIEQCEKANEKGVKIITFPELCLTAYSCADLFGQALLLDAVEEAINTIATESNKWDMLLFIGAPLRNDGNLYNCAVCIEKGKVLGVVPKTFLPNYNEFYEKRWFVSATNTQKTTIAINGNDHPFGTQLMFVKNDIKIAVEICEDLWTPIPPSSIAAIAGANIIINMSASNEVLGKHDYLLSLISQQSARCIAAYLYSSAGYGESTTDLVFGGNAIIAENGNIVAKGDRFSTISQMSIYDIDVEMLIKARRNSSSFTERIVDSFTEIPISIDTNKTTHPLIRQIERHPFVPANNEMLNRNCNEIINIQTLGLMRRLDFTHTKSLVVGVSGGLDSTLALLVAVQAFDRLKLNRKNIIGITMPGFGTTDRTYNNALVLMQELGITIEEISITDAVIQHFKDINHDINVHDITYENSQARERTQVLMDYANKCNAMVLGTGDLSELALGWATYNGDHMSMYGVNASIPKTLIKHLVKWIAINSTNPKATSTLLDIVDTPISPELIPADENGNIKQKTEDLVGPYELHDFFLYYILRHGFTPAKIYYLAKQAFTEEYDSKTIKQWLKVFYRRFFTQQFKRSCLPDGPKVGSVCLSPRGDWRMPSDAAATLWLTAINNL